MMDKFMGWLDTIFNTGGGLIGWIVQFVTKYANTLLLIGLVLAISKVTSGNQVKLKV